MLSARLIDSFVQNVYVERGGTGGITPQDRAEGKKRLDAYLLTSAGRAQLDAETPAPLGNGKLRKRMTKVPDPFSDFDVEAPELDLWLGNDRIEGRARVTGVVNGFGFNANIRFRARPVLVTQQPTPAIEMHNIEIDDPDLDISLPVWLEWAFGGLAGFIAGPVIGVIVGFLLSSIISSLVEALIPSGLGSMVPAPDAQPIGKLPPGVTFTDLTVVPEFLAVLGRWTMTIEDPRPFYPGVRISDKVEPVQVGPEREGRAWFGCAGVLGIVMDSNEQYGTPFTYTHRNWRSRVIVEVEAIAVPFPLTRFPWTIAVGHRSMAQYHFPVVVTPPQPLVPGDITFTSNVWHPEPPLRGRIASKTFSIVVQRSDEDRFTLDVPAGVGCIIIELNTKVIDAAGVTWNLSTFIDVANETVAFGADFEEFTDHCESQRREWKWVKEPSRLDKVWNPPDFFALDVQRAIRTEQPAVTTDIGTLLEVRGKEAFNILLAPSLMKGRT